MRHLLMLAFLGNIRLLDSFLALARILLNKFETANMGIRLGATMRTYSAPPGSDVRQRVPE